MAKHARLSPSGAHKWMECPPSLAAERGIPEQRSEHAAEGTAAHAVAEAVLRALNPSWVKSRPAFSKLAASDYVGETVEGWVITDDMAEPIQTYIDTVMAAAHGNTLHVEQRVDFSHVVGVRNSFGTADAIIINGDELQVHDLKFGRGVRVDAENNYQLMIYALGALRVFELGSEFNTVRLFIHQPRLNHVSEWALSVQALKDFGKIVKSAAKKAISWFTAAEAGKQIPVDAMQPGEKACRWCKAAPTCAAYARFVYDAVAAEFVDLDAAEFDAKDVSKLTGAQLAQAHANLDFIEAWIGKVRKECFRRLINGDQLPGMKVVKGRPGYRVWRDIDAAESALLMHAANDDIYAPRKLITPPQAERLLKNRPEEWEKLKPFITRSEGSPVVVPASDPREPIGDESDVFEIIQGE
ncbi:DUF2800 domain-containing protein [Leclercia sp. Marseille-Q4284]|uniref:DUF2800 domain-containing protein n=1 Tax=Leclercia sp. Marseille-Q4284 TaxID=2866582 RepID=UPI001CE4866D|nr:DUF2800 domain-containing protein [Leclercia sp. Marseille-Q4284]